MENSRQDKSSTDEKLTPEERRRAEALRRKYLKHPVGYTAEELNKWSLKQFLDFQDWLDDFDMIYDIFGDEADGWYPEWFSQDIPADDAGPGPFDDDPSEPTQGKDEDLPF